MTSIEPDKDIWKNNYARKLKDLEFYYSAGPTRCAIPENNLQMLKRCQTAGGIDGGGRDNLQQSSRLSSARSSAREQHNKHNNNNSKNKQRAPSTYSSSSSRATNRTSRSGDVSDIDSLYYETSYVSSNRSEGYYQKVQQLESQLEAVQSERKQAQQLLQQTEKQLTQLEEYLKEKEKAKK